jgi:hypothetical protein
VTAPGSRPRTSHEVHCRYRALCAGMVGGYRVPALRHGRRFRPRWRFFIPTVLRPLPARVHSLVRRALSGVSSPVLPAPPCGGAACPGVSSLFAALPVESTFRELPSSRDVPSSGFRNLSTASSTTGVAGLFHPAATSRVSVQGFGPDPQPCRLVAGSCPLALVARLLTGHPAATTAQSSFEALLHGARRASKSVVGLRRRRSPLRFLLLQALASASRCHTITVQRLRSWPSLQSVHRCVAAPVLAPQPTFSVSATRPLVARLRVHPPARGSCLPAGLAFSRAQVPTTRRARPGDHGSGERCSELDLISCDRGPGYAARVINNRETRSGI